MTLNIMLRDSKTREIRWSKEYPGSLRNYLQLVHGTAEDLRQKLLPDSQPVASASGLAANSEAELIYQRAKYVSNRYNNLHRQADFDLACADFKRALGLDPKLADAAAEVAWLFYLKAAFGGSGQAAITEAESWTHRAIEIDPRCGLGWHALGMCEFLKLRPDKRELLECGLKAVRFAPQDPRTYISLNNAPIGTVLSMPILFEGYRRDALFFNNEANIGLNLFWLGRLAEGLPYIDEVLRVEPAYVYGLLIKSFIIAESGRTEEAAEILKKAESQIPEGSVISWWVPFAHYILALEREDSQSAEPMLKQILQRMNDPNTVSLEIDTGTLFLLPVLVRHGQMETALQILKRDVEAGYNLNYDVFALHPSLESLRRDVRSRPMLEKSRSDFVEWMRVLDEARSRGELPLFLEAPFADLLKKLDIKL